MNPKETKLLLVDDDLVDSECILRHLKKRDVDFEAHALEDGEQALAYLRENCVGMEEGRVVVLLDINMPGINGHEFLEEIRNDPVLRSVIVFVCTSSTHQRDITKAYEKNVAGYFVKGDPSGLLDTLESFVENVEFPSFKHE